MNVDKLYQWEKIVPLINEFLPTWVDAQQNIRKRPSAANFTAADKQAVGALSFDRNGKDAEMLLQFLTESVYPKRWLPNHPRYLSFIPSPVSAFSAMADFCNGMHNPYAAGYSISNGTAILEEQTLAFLAQSVGYNADLFGGQFTSGGSLANLTGIIVARDQKLPLEKQRLGRMYVSDQAHSSVAKAARMLGFLPEQVVAVETDEAFKIDPQSVEEAILEDLKKGFIPFLIVATAGTTNTGIVDPLEELANIKETHDLWLHVDGAYGASVALSSHKDLLKGIERSDSLSWDGHKWLFQTYSCGIILVQNRQHLYDSFHTNPEYLKAVEGSLKEANFWDLGMEMTRPARGIKLWYTLQAIGLDVISEAIDWGFALAEYFAALFQKAPDWQIISGPHMSIVNVRFAPYNWSAAQLDAAQEYLCQKAFEKGYSTYITTELNGQKVIRFCACHPQLTKEEVKVIVEDLLKEAEDLKKHPERLNIK